MTGLLGQNRSAGLLSGGLLAQNRGATPEALRRKQEADRQAALLAARSAPPAAPRRERVSGWRMLDRVLFGTGPIGAELDAERARLEAEAMRPQQMAIAAENERIARGLGPEALLAFRLNGEKLGGELSERFGTDVLAAGSGLFSGGQRIGEQARTVESGDQVLRVGSDGVTPLYTRTDPSIAERTAMTVAETGRINATNPVPIAPGVRLLDPATGSVRGEGAPRVFSAGDGVDLVQEGAGQIYSNPKDAPAGSTATPPAVLEFQGRIDTTLREVVPSLNRMREILTSGDPITGFGAEARLQAARIAAAAGNQEAIRRVAATEEIKNLAGRLRVGLAKTLGSNPSNADLLLLNQVSGGDIGQNPETLLRLVDQGLELSNRQVADLERQMRAAMPARGASPQGQASGPIAQDAQGNRVQWNGSAWVPIR